MSPLPEEGTAVRPGPRFSFRVRLLALLIPLLVLFGLLEIAFRVAGYDPRPLAIFGETEQTDAYVRHPRYLWTARPSEHLDVPECWFRDVRTNSLGLRGPEIPPPGPPDELRVLCLGDSITFGLGLSSEETWPRHAERTLAAGLGRPVVVVNAGVVGFSSVQGMRLYRDLVSGGGYDYVVFWFGMNDARPATAGIPDRWYRFDPGPLSGPFDLLSRSRVLQLLLYSAHRLLGGDAHHVSIREFRSAIGEILAGAEEGGPRPVFIRSPEVISTTIEELAAMTAQARDYQVTRLSGPKDLFSPYGPYFYGSRTVGRIVVTDQGPILSFGDSSPEIVTFDLAEIEASLLMLRSWKERTDLLAGELPADALGASDLLGSRLTRLLFADNCHLTALGARMAGDAIGREILRREGK